MKAVTLSFTLCLLLSSAALPAGAYDSDQPPAYRALDAAESAQAARGYALFKSRFGIAPVNSAGHVGLGPLYNATSCNECHNQARHAEGPRGAGEAPPALVIELAASAGGGGQGDPVYGEVLNTHAIDGTQPEGTVLIEYSQVVGYYYPFGGRWNMRAPRYRILGLTRGPLAPSTVLSPRLAPQLFGLGLLEAVPESSLARAASLGAHGGSVAYHTYLGQSRLGRMGWQSEAVSIRDQVSRALAREMGVTSSDRPRDDCTVKETDCQPNGTAPEASNQVLEDLTTFVRTLAVPTSSTTGKAPAAGAATFKTIGCTECHRPQLTAQLSGEQLFSPYTDLRLHDLGMQMADETVGGTRVATHWRTAPLWGIGYRLQTEKYPTFLHDGRARSVEEAILWHYGEAGRARFRFISLGPNARDALLQWLQTL